MPVKIYESLNSDNQLAWLCDGEWKLKPQIDALKEWLLSNHAKIKQGDYIADVGFVHRIDATGGGAVIPPEMMKIMLDLNIYLHLSEYGLPLDNESLTHLNEHLSIVDKCVVDQKE